MSDLPARRRKPPGCPFRSSDPDGFATISEIIDYIDAYARKIQAPWPRVHDGPLFRAVRPDSVSLLVST